MTLTVRPLGPDELGDAWDAGLDRFAGVTLFSRWVYLRHLGAFEILAVFDGDEIALALPVPIVPAGSARAIGRSSFVSPYFPPLFRRAQGHAVRVESKRRAALRALIEHIQREFVSMALPLHPDLTDMVPFQRAHFQLEWRTTYALPLESLNALWQGFAPSVRNHIRRASAVSVAVEPHLTDFDFDAAVFYEDAHGCAQWQALAADLVANDLAVALIARQDGRPVGGLFLAHDDQTAYNLLSYFDRDTAARGVPSALIWAAARAARARGLRALDLEGSVLPNIEDFYQRFGGQRRGYHQVHWFADERRQTPVLYRYLATP